MENNENNEGLYRKIPKNNRFPTNFLYLASLVIFFATVFIGLKFSNSITVKKYEVVESNGHWYELKSSGNYTIVELGGDKGLGVLDMRAGKLVADTFYFISSNDDILKVTPNFILNAKPNLFDFLIRMGINKEEDLKVTNPPYITFTLIPLLIAIIANIVQKVQ